MAGIIKTSINLNAIPKDKIFVGKKGKYLPITITINDEVDMFCYSYDTYRDHVPNHTKHIVASGF